jgi:hypothetical protein
MLLVIPSLFWFYPNHVVLANDTGKPIVGNGRLPFLPHFSVIHYGILFIRILSVPIFLSADVPPLHVILSVVIIPPRDSDPNQPKALIDSEDYHIDTYERIGYKAGRTYSKVMWEA